LALILTLVLLLVLLRASLLNGSSEFVDDIIELSELLIEDFDRVVSHLVSGILKGSDELLSNILRNLRSVLVEGVLSVVNGVVEVVSNINSFLRLRISLLSSSCLVPSSARPG
jgi:vacuolar-type H+-ATPase subunit I/STV1